MSTGSVRDSTRGGRGVLRSAAAVEAASLRSLGLGATLPLAALGNPLAGLLDLAPDLSVLEEMLGRTANPASVRRAPSARPAPAQQTPGTRTRSAVESPAATARNATPGRAAAAPAPASPTQPGAIPAPASSTHLPHTAAASRATPGTTPRAHSTANPAAAGGPTHQSTSATHTAPPLRAAPPEPSPGEVRAAGSTSALRRAARSSGRPAAGASEVAPATRAPASRASAQLDPATASGQPTALPTSLPTAPGARTTAGQNHPLAANASDPTPNLPVPVTPEFSRGGLAELVTRWQDSQPSRLDPDESPADAHVFTPLSGASFERERPLRLGDEDRIELALAQVLRREVERHGLEGGR